MTTKLKIVRTIAKANMPKETIQPGHALMTSNNMPNNIDTTRATIVFVNIVWTQSFFLAVKEVVITLVHDGFVVLISPEPPS